MQEDIGADVKFNNFTASASVFNNHIQHYIYLSQVTDLNGSPLTDAQGNKPYQYQQSAAQLYGVEAMLNLHPSLLKGFSFDNSFSIIRGNNKKESNKSKGVMGEFLPLIPPTKILSSVNKHIELKSKLIEAINLKAEVEFNAAQNRFLALNETETATPGYTLFNLSMNTQIHYSKNSPFQLQLQVNNVLDKSYQSNLSRLKYFEYYTPSPNVIREYII